MNELELKYILLLLGLLDPEAYPVIRHNFTKKYKNRYYKMHYS